MNVVLEPSIAQAFRSCVEVGAEGLGDSRSAILDAVAAGRETDLGVVFTFPDGAMDDVRSAFTVGWEGLEPYDELFDESEKVAQKLGLSPVSPVP